MVTKVRTIRQATEFASNFEQNPETTSGNLFGYYAGSVIDINGTVFEFPAGSVAVSAGTYYMYVDMSPSTPTINLESTITSGNYVVLYRITNSGGSLTWTDLRSWTAASIGDDLLQVGEGATDPLTSHETLINSYSPLIWYRFNEGRAQAQVALLNSGTLGSDWDLPIINDANDQYLAQWVRVPGGDVEGAKAMPMALWQPNGTITGFGFRKTGLDSATLAPFTASGTGTWIMVAAFAYNEGNDTLFHFNNTVSDAEFEVGMFNNNLEIDFLADSGTTGDWEVQSSSTVNQVNSFPIYKHMVLVQPGDGTGPVLYIDGVDAGNYAGVGAGEEDYWFDNWTTNFPSTFSVGGAFNTDTTMTANFAGNFEQLAYTTTALSQAQVEALYAAWSGA